MTEGHMYRAVMDFIHEIKESQEFKDYRVQLAKIQDEPKLYDKVNEFRQKNYIIQSTEEGEAFNERMDELEREFEDVRAIPLVDDFLAAELCFCRMMQEINEMIWDEIDFQ